MSSEKYLSYRGRIKSITGSGKEVFFVTEHPEVSESSLYIIDVEKTKLDSFLLPEGGISVLFDSKYIWVLGKDRKVYRSEKKGKPTAVAEISSNAVAMCLLSESRIGVLTENEIEILNSEGKITQTLSFQELSEGGQGFSIASDPTGNFFTVGTDNGFCIVFECEGKDEFKLSESAKIHSGSVNTILFEKEELSFLSAGSDQKVFITHARGKLEPIERSSEVHDGRITSSVMGTDRFYTAGFDKTIKAWAKTGKPATMKDGVGKVIGLTLITVDDHEHIACACTDNTIRVYSIDEAGRVDELKTRFNDAYKSAKRDLDQDKAADRIKTLKVLASYDDFTSVKMIEGHIQNESDPEVKLKCVNFLSASKHEKAADFLYPYLKNDDAKLRISAFKGLIDLKGKENLLTIDKALASKRSDVGIEAVKLLEKLTSKNEQLIVRLFNALNINPYAVRVQALYSLENLYGKKSVEASLKALQSKFEDIRKLALIRIYQRGLLNSIEVSAAIHKHCEDESRDVRKIAFYLLIMTKKNLAEILRQKDKNVHRQIYEIETFGKKGVDKLPEVKKTKVKLSAGDYEPLLFAMACRVVDTCLEGAKLLAILEDTRAFGLLLQLSREDDVDTRVSVCQAFSSLADKRCIRHLINMLEDEAQEVRDAAFSALKNLYSETFDLVRDTFKSDFSDVRQRALQVLVDHIREENKEDSETAQDLLLTALNDNDASLRNEAFKSALNLKIKGGNEKTLIFINQSYKKDVRNEVLNEVKASEKNAWAEEVLFRFFNDNDKNIRKEAFEYSLNRKKGKKKDVLAEAIKSDKVDIRLLSVENLLKTDDESVVEILVPAINDKNYRVRKSVIEALVKINEKETLIKALKSEYYDVRALAAKARAVFGDIEVFEPLKGLLEIEEPKENTGVDEPEKDKIDLNKWKNLIILALEGLCELGDDKAIELITPFLKNKNSEVKLSAVKAISGLCSEKAYDTLKESLKDDDLNLEASKGLSFLGDEKSFNRISGKLDEKSLLSAAVVNGSSSDERLYSLLGSKDDIIRKTAYLVINLLELSQGNQHPERLVTCLSAKDESIRFLTAKALKMYPDEYKEFASDLFNDKGDKPSFNIPKEDIEIVASTLLKGEAFTKLKILNSLFLLNEKKQTSWDRSFKIFRERFSDEIKNLSESPHPSIPENEKFELMQLSFGSFVGLVREQGGYHSSERTTPERVVIRIREKALNELLKMGKNDPSFFEALKPVFLQTLRDPISNVRMRAFTLLKESEADTAVLGAEALGAGFMDIGREGLKLLTESASKKDQESILEQTMITRDDGLELEAAKILVEMNGKLKTSRRVFESVSVKLQRTAIGWLSDLYEQDKKAREILLAGFSTRFREIYFKIAFILSAKKDKDAFTYLEILLNNHENEGELERVVNKMVELNATGTLSALISKIRNDRQGEFDRILLSAVGSLRDDGEINTLFEIFKQRKNKRYIFNAILSISGFDQKIDDYDDENPDKSLEKKQFPRKAYILSELLSISMSLNETGFIQRLIEGARWARENDSDKHLSRLINYPDDSIREKTIAALSFRLKKRGASKDALVKMLEVKDPTLKFLAAEGLALAGHNEGLPILLAAVELLEDYSHRKRAVKALGVSKDPRAIDILLKLANDREHALSEEAIEAIGHLGKTDSRDEVFLLLSKLAAGNDGISEKAIKGLRWFNTEDGWKLVRLKAVSNDYYYRETAIEMLAYNNDDYTKKILLDLIKNDNDDYVIEKSVDSARKLFGPESLEPDYAAVQCSSRWYSVKESLERIGKKGDPEIILSILHKCQDKNRVKLTEIILNLKPAPFDAAFKTLSGNNEDSVAVAAYILGRAKEINPDYSIKIADTTNIFLEKWKKTRSDFANKKVEEKKLKSITGCLSKLMWLSGRYGVAVKTIIEAASYPFDSYFTPVKKEAVTALAEFKTDDAREALIKALSSGNAEVRTIAAQALSGKGLNPEEIMNDRTIFMSAIDDFAPSEAINKAAESSDYQGVVLPLLIRNRDIPGLDKIMVNSNLDEEIRFGAIESLAQLRDEKAEEKLSAFAGKNDVDEDIKKAIFRALRQSKRGRMKSL